MLFIEKKYEQLRDTATWYTDSTAPKLYENFQQVDINTYTANRIYNEVISQINTATAKD